MVYRAIGIMSGSSLEGLDIVFAEFDANQSGWNYKIIAGKRYPYSLEWVEKIKKSTSVPALDYLLLHAEFGHYIGKEVNRFIGEHQLEYQVQLIVSHGHTTYHLSEQNLSAQLGAGSAIAAETGINVVCELRAMDVALGGKGAPLIPLGEKMLLSGYQCFLNIGGIANMTCHTPEGVICFDVVAVNKVLNKLASLEKEPYDAFGKMAARGEVKPNLLEMLNDLEYYRMPYPKTLSGDFATDVVYPLLNGMGVSTEDAMRTYVEHIAVQTANALRQIYPDSKLKTQQPTLLLSGGGANNTFLANRIREVVEAAGIAVVIPDHDLINFKEALIMAFLGILRWREENNVLSVLTGASRDSIGGAVWIGQEA